MKPTVNQRLRYQFDNWMARGTSAMIGMLFMLSFVIIFAGGLVLLLTGFMQEGSTEHLSFWEGAWISLMHALDSGAIGADAGTGFRAVMMLVTLGGIFIVSALIGVLNNAIENQMERLRKGRSQVLESNHTLILGWSAQIFTIINELMIANDSEKNARIVVLADKDKMEMEDEIRERVELRGTTRIICRSGSPFDPSDLEIVSPHDAKSIIVLPPENENPDIDVIKATLAITNNPKRHAGPYHIVTQIRDSKNMAVLKLIGEKDTMQAVLTGDLIARVVAQTSRQSGLSMVYTELLDFAGDEIYFKQEASLTGKTFADALLAYENSCVIGIRKADKTISLNPPMDSRFESGDRIITIASDNDNIMLSSLTPSIDEALVRSNAKTVQAQPEKCLVLGWNRSGITILHELDHYVPKGSQVTVVADHGNLEEEIISQGGSFENQTLAVVKGETTDRSLLGKLNIPDYDHVIVLAHDTVTPEQADAKTLVTLLHLRDMAQKDETPFSIVSEMLDLRNRELAEVTKVDDFIVSEHLASLMMAQISENSELFEIFNEIFDPAGAEIYLKPVSDYVVTGQPVNFYTVVEAARRRGETALGYRITSEENTTGLACGIYTNPKKSAPVTFSALDKIIVIAQD